MNLCLEFALPDLDDSERRACAWLAVGRGEGREAPKSGAARSLLTRVAQSWLLESSIYADNPACMYADVNDIHPLRYVLNADADSDLQGLADGVLAGL